MDAQLYLSKGALADCLSDPIVADRLSFILALMTTLIPRLGVMLVFWFFTCLLVLTDFIIVIYIIRIGSWCLSLRALLSFGLIELVISSMLCRNGAEGAHQVFWLKTLANRSQPLIIWIRSSHAQVRERIFLLLIYVD